MTARAVLVLNDDSPVMFPIVYLLFLVPFGDSLVPPLQTLTAKLSMAMLAW